MFLCFELQNNKLLDSVVKNVKMLEVVVWNTFCTYVHSFVTSKLVEFVSTKLLRLMFDTRLVVIKITVIIIVTTTTTRLIYVKYSYTSLFIKVVPTLVFGSEYGPRMYMLKSTDLI